MFKRPLTLFFVLLATLTAIGFYAANADAHGWHWTKCRSGGRLIRGHTANVFGLYSWYGPWYNCSGTWQTWEYYYTDKVWP